MRDLRRQGLWIIDLTTRLNDFAVTVSPDLLSSSSGITIRENSKLEPVHTERSRDSDSIMHGTTPPYVSWGNRSDPVVSRPNHKFAANRASCSSNKSISALCMQETQIKCRGLDPRCLKARFCWHFAPQRHLLAEVSRFLEV
ncbi:unnamed protein product [Lasius platythorax]|uniref:Uncharacterized protein n=1 Tax=Lasius platythorax TaxID=488582 RepID=A0AAV2NKM2_9HYME